jgi:hypothetical protein
MVECGEDAEAGGVTLPEALEVCHGEYNHLVRSFTPEREQIERKRVAEDQDAIIASTPFRSMMRVAVNSLEAGDDPEKVARIFLVLAMRFGMRVQAKLQSANAVNSQPANENEKSAKP